MKTLDNTITLNHSRERVRLGMTLAGIVAAVICAVALLSEASFMPREVSLPQVGTPDITSVSLPAVGKSLATSIWPF